MQIVVSFDRFKSPNDFGYTNFICKFLLDYGIMRAFIKIINIYACRFICFLRHQFWHLKNIRRLKKKVWQNSLYIIGASILSSKKPTFSFRYKFFCCMNLPGKKCFPWGMVNEWLGEKVEVFWGRKRKNGKTQSNTWNLACVFWGGLLIKNLLINKVLLFTCYEVSASH